MKQRGLSNIFLSASIPFRERHRKYYDTADFTAIRDAVRALATTVIPGTHLIWGGHPAITPLIRYVMEKMKANLKDRVTVYQSAFFEKDFPTDNFFFEDIVVVPRESTIEMSLESMRKSMILGNCFDAGVFIGGMEGIELEYEMFSDAHPNALILPIASTGAGAKILYDKIAANSPSEIERRLLTDYAYKALFRDLLGDLIKPFDAEDLNDTDNGNENIRDL